MLDSSAEKPPTNGSPLQIFAMPAPRELATRFEAYGNWRTRLAGWDGQWAIVQDTLELFDDPQVEANGYVQTLENAGGTSFELVSVPVQYDGQPAAPRRAPEFNEHGDDILGELGFDMDQIVDLKVRGVVA